MKAGEPPRGRETPAEAEELPGAALGRRTWALPLALELFHDLQEAVVGGRVAAEADLHLVQVRKRILHLQGEKASEAQRGGTDPRMGAGAPHGTEGGGNRPRGPTAPGKGEQPGEGHTAPDEEALRKAGPGGGPRYGGGWAWGCWRRMARHREGHGTGERGDMSPGRMSPVPEENSRAGERGHGTGEGENRPGGASRYRRRRAEAPGDPTASGGEGPGTPHGTSGEDRRRGAGPAPPTGQSRSRRGGQGRPGVGGSRAAGSGPWRRWGGGRGGERGNHGGPGRRGGRRTHMHRQLLLRRGPAAAAAPARGAAPPAAAAAPRRHVGSRAAARPPPPLRFFSPPLPAPPPPPVSACGAPASARTASPARGGTFPAAVGVARCFRSFNRHGGNCASGPGPGERPEGGQGRGGHHRGAAA